MAKNQDPVDIVLEAIDELKDKHDKQLNAMQEQLDQIQMVSNRPSMGGGGPATRQSKELVQAFGTFIRTGDDKPMNAMSVGVDDAGGYLVLPERSTGWTKKLQDYSPIRRLARVQTITSGDSFEEPVDHDDVDAEFVGEHSGRSDGADPEIGLLTIHLDEIHAQQPITQRLIDDASVDMLAWMEDKVGDKFARKEGEKFILGTGVQMPQGILSAPVSADLDATRAWGTLQFVVSGAAAAITADGLRNLMWGLRAPYRRGAAWVMNSNAASLIDKLKDGNGNYLWRDSMSAGVPPTLLGYPVEFDENMPDVSAGTFPIAFGNFKLGYLIVDRPGVKFLRDPYTRKPNVLVYAYKRVGGGIANSEAIKLLKVGT